MEGKPTFSHEDSDLAAFRWSLDECGYARRHLPRPGIRKQVAHRAVAERMLGRPLKRGEECDHLNRNRLDNRRENIAVVTHAMNLQNSGGRRYGSAGGLRGVHWNKGNARWEAQVRFGGRKHQCGSFIDIVDAAASAAAKRRELGFHGEPPANITKESLSRLRCDDWYIEHRSALRAAREGA